MTCPLPHRRNSWLALAAPLLLLAGCGGSGETVGSAGTGDVAAKAVADVDAAMADVQRARTAPKTAATP